MERVIKLTKNFLLFPRRSQGPAKAVDEKDAEVIKAKKSGFSNPNLHRYLPSDSKDDLAPRDYTLSIQGNNSYRTIRVDHSTENTANEIP